MPKQSVIQTAFNGGVFSPILDGHIDAPRRNVAYKDSNNLIALKQGPLVRRGGTQNVYESIRVPGATRGKLVRFFFNDEQAYILEFTGGFMRVYKDGGVVTFAATDETITGITAADPAVVSIADTTDYVSGNWVNFTGLTEATHLNDRWFRIKTVVLNTSYELYDSDFNTSISNAVAETSSTGTSSRSQFIATPYNEAALFRSDGSFIPDLVQSNDVMYIAHPDFMVRALTRTADDIWTISTMEFDNGPYLPINTSDIYLTVVLVGGYVWTVTSTTGIFAATDTSGTGGTGEIDRLIRINQGTVDAEEYTVDEKPKTQIWVWARITEYVSATQVDVTIDSDQKNFNSAWIIGSISNTYKNPKDWQLGAYSTTTGFPSVIDIHEGRVAIGVNTDEPRRVDLSTASGFNLTEFDFSPNSDKLFVRPDDAISLTIGGNNQSPIQWLSSTSNGLAVGTANSEGVIRSSNNNEAMTPENASYRSSTTVGSTSIQPLKIDDSLLFVQKAKRRLHELSYSFEKDGLIAPDMTELAEHVTVSGIIDIVYQQQPINTLWVLMADGSLKGFTYERVSDVLGWHPHTIGGTDMQVLSIAVIPSTDLTRDELWLAVQRTISGKAVGYTSRTYIERMLDYYRDTEIREEIIQQDGGQQYIATKLLITDATSADPVNITSATHGLSGGENIYIAAIVGTPELNGRTFKAVYVDADNVTLTTVGGTNIDGTNYGAYQSGGTAQLSTATFIALDYLEGETLEVYVDGNLHGNIAVSGGAITLNNGLTGANVSVGFGTTWHFEAFPVEGGSGRGAAQGKKKKVTNPIVRLLNTLGFKYGIKDEDMVEESFLYGANVNSATPLYSDDLVMDWPGGFDTKGTVYFEGDGPFPVQIQALINNVDTNDQTHG